MPIFATTAHKKSFKFQIDRKFSDGMFIEENSAMTFKSSTPLFLSLLFLLAGCSGGGESPSETADPQPVITATPTATPAPTRIYRDCIVDASPFGAGDGSEIDPYLICTVAHLNEVNSHLNAHFELNADLDLANASFTPIGNDSAFFTGVFDGADHTISNFSLYGSTASVGFFAHVSEGAILKNLHLTGVTLTTDINIQASAGLLAGAASGYSLIQNCSTEGTIQRDGSAGIYGGLVGWMGAGGGMIFNSHATISFSGNSLDYTGGLIGISDTASIVNSYSEGNVSGNESVGGLVGFNYIDTSIINSYSAAEVSGNAYVGGLIGWNYATGSLTEYGIFNSYATGSVSGNNLVGGLIGVNTATLTLKNSYATGQVTGGGAGGLIGYYSSPLPTETGSFWDVETTGQSTSIAGTGKTTAEMKDPATFIDWDQSIWHVTAGNYPSLAIQPIPSPALLVISEGYRYNFGEHSISSPVPDKVFTLINHGDTAASFITASAGVNLVFLFKGGAFPGTGGTCGASLAGHSQCTIVISPDFSSPGVYVEMIQISYTDFFGARSLNQVSNITVTN